LKGKDKVPARLARDFQARKAKYQCKKRKLAEMTAKLVATNPESDTEEQTAGTPMTRQKSMPLKSMPLKSMPRGKRWSEIKS
jgi:hypothetical protein